MNIAVTVKQIPDPAARRSTGRPTPSIASGKLILDDSDAYGVEMALQLAEPPAVARSTLVSMAPNGESPACAPRSRWARPGDARVRRRRSPAPTPSAPPRCSPRRSSGPASTWCSRPPSRPTATRHHSPRRSRSCSGWPSLTFAKHVELGGGKVTIQRQTENGYDTVEAALPAVVSVTAGVVEPRYPSFKGIMAAKNKPVDAAASATSASRPTRSAGPAPARRS